MTDYAGKPQLKLLGGFELSLRGHLSPDSQRLLAYLGLERFNRDHLQRLPLAETLWPDTEGHRARARLRTAIWSVRETAASVITVTRTTVGLAPDVDVDVVRLQRLAHRLLVGGHRPDGELPEPFDACLEGTLLPEWDDFWLDLHRQRLDQLQLHVLDELRERYRRAGNMALAIDCALRVIERDPLRESAHAALVDLYYRAGNAHAARRHFQRYSALMAAELGPYPRHTPDGIQTQRRRDGNGAARP